MRAALILLALACAFALAALWQDRHLARLREERAAAIARADGTLAETPAGPLPAGRAVVTVGRPSGAEPVTPPRAAPAPEQAAARRVDPPPAPAQDPAAAALADFEMVVQPGHTLSQIAHAHYRRHDRALLEALARYNGLESIDSLRAGEPLLLPPLERLLE